MLEARNGIWAAAACAALLATGACGGGDREEPAPAAQQTAAPAPPVVPELRLEVDVAARQVHVYRRDQLEKSYGVAVGRPEWPTQNGEWTVSSVVWNPGWTPPPDEEWTKDETPKDPGDPDNPLGRVQIVYDPPRTIHGTNQPESIGKAVSHGSIRMRNEEAAELARLVMVAGGAQREESFFAEAERNRSTRYEVNLPNPVPIRVINGVDNADAVEGERDGGASSSGGGATAPARTQESRPKRTEPAARPDSAAADSA